MEMVLVLTIYIEEKEYSQGVVDHLGLKFATGDDIKWVVTGPVSSVITLTPSLTATLDNYVSWTIKDSDNDITLFEEIFKYKNGKVEKNIHKFYVFNFLRI